MDFACYVKAVLIFSLIETSVCEFAEHKEPPTIPHPYSFSYAAGRYPGHVDRVHAETSDGSGAIRGMFSYIDPRYKVRTIEYIADQNGFHPLVITNPTSDTNAVAKAKEKHETLYNQIALQHQQIAQERGQTEEQDERQYNEQIYPQNANIVVDHPRDTPVVEYAKARHYDLYQKIAEEHARIASERKQIIPESEVQTQY